jgi:stearoyl-CoA desaturase (delta-9 desaturase)
MSAVTTAPYVPVALGLPTRPLRWIRSTIIFAGPLLAPFFFSWSAVIVLAILHFPLGYMYLIGHHRLFSHRSFHAKGPLRYVIAFVGSLANQGGPMVWAAAHRAHHAHADEEGDPHSPRHSRWWSYVGWLYAYCPAIDDPEQLRKRVHDLTRDPGLRFIEWTEPIWQILFAVALYFGGAALGGPAVGVSWVVWGWFVRVAIIYHSAAIVNTFAHEFGYRTFETRDLSTNLWPALPLAAGDCWHNNHHACARSARHGGLRWWESDIAYDLIHLFAKLGWATDVHLPDRVLYPSRPARRAAVAQETPEAVGVS